MDYKKEYFMTIEENIFLAKRQIIDTIYKQAKMEGINITFPQTKVIYEQGIIDKMSVLDIQKIINLKRAWNNVLNTIKDELNTDYIKRVHYDVSLGEALYSGKLRNGTVGVEGVNYIPKIPTENDFNNFIKAIKDIKNPVERALEYIALGIKNQFFWDCNKRTSFIIANKILINSGSGIISVPEDKILDFHNKLKLYYDEDKKEEFKEFLYNNAITGIKYNEENNINEEKPPILK